MDIKEIIQRGGGPTKLGKAIGKKHSTVIGWTRIPAEHVPAISKLTGIPRHEMRPELWEHSDVEPASSDVVQPVERAPTEASAA